MSLYFRKKPHPHQKDEFFAHRATKARVRVWHMRTGKSKSCIDDAGWLFHKGLITGVLVLAPNMVHANWLLKEFPEHSPVPFSGQIFYSDRASTKKSIAAMKPICTPGRRLRVLAIPASSVATANGKKYMNTFIKAHKGKVLVIFDEAHDYKHPDSARTKTARATSGKCDYKRLLTGTPISGSPLNAYSIYQLVEEGALGFTLYDDFKGYFANWRMQKTKSGKSFPVLTSYRNLDELARRMEPWTSVVGRDQVKGLSQTVSSEVLVEMTPRQRKVYDTFFNNPIINDKLVDGAAFMSKLQQISSGFILGDKGQCFELVKPENNPRLQMVLSLVQSAVGKVIVWAKYRYEYEALAKLFKAAGIEYCEVHGESQDERDKIEIVYDFGRSKTIKVCIGNPVSGGIGLDYSFVDTIIYCSHTFDLVVKSQADERGTAFGKDDVDIIHVVCQNSQDRYVLNSVKDKAEVSEIVLDDIQELKKRIKASND